MKALKKIFKNRKGIFRGIRNSIIKKRKIEIGISLFEEDITSHKYNQKMKILKIGYRHYDGIRIAVLPMTSFTVPSDIEKVVVFDDE